MGAGDGFGNEIERMLMDRPLTRHSVTGGGSGGGPAPMSSGIPGNTLDELMAELGMLRGERGDPALVDPLRQLGRNGTRSGPRTSICSGDGAVSGGGSLLGSSFDGSLRPSTPRSAAAAAAAAAGVATGGGLGGQLVLPPARGALPAPPAAAASSSISSTSCSGPGPGRAQSPMAVSGSINSRRSVPGVMGPLGGGGGVGPPGASGGATPPAGVIERQSQFEGRLEKMEAREQQLMALISQLQQQVATLSRAQQSTAQLVNNLTATTTTSAATQQQQQPPTPQVAAAAPPASGRQSGPSSAAAAAAPITPPAPDVSDEDFIQNDDDDESPEASPRQRSETGGAGPSPPMAPQPQPPQQPWPQRLGMPTAGGPGGGGGARANKLIPAASIPPDWEVDASQLRRELAALAANVVRLRDQMSSLVPGGPSPLGEEVAAQGSAAAQLKQNLTQIAMDVVSLHKGLTSLKQASERGHTALEKSINDLQLQIQTNALNAFAAGPPPGTSGAGLGDQHNNAVAAALAATGGLSGSLEESLRSAFATPAVRSLPAFNPPGATTADLGFMPDNGGAAAAAAAFGGAIITMAGGGGGGGGGGRHAAAASSGGGGGGGGLGAAMALLSSFEEQAAAEQAEQQKAAVIARQAMSLVDAKVRQVVVHVDRHMQSIATDVEERLRMYEQTIIRMAQQIDRVQRVLRDIEGTAVNRIVVRQGGKEVADEDLVLGGQQQQEEAVAAEGNAAKQNWVKAAAMATGRFVPQKPEEKKPATKNSPHGYFRTPP